MPAGSAEGSLEIAPGAIVAGKFRLERPLSRGAMGSVWVATHLGLDTLVAIKFMAHLSAEPPVESTPSSSSMSNRKRFEHEAKAAAQIRSANVVQILDYGVDHGTPYIAMELLEGEDLGARLKRTRTLTLGETSQIVAAVARALQRAHDAKLVHRDLKPANIFLAREGDDEVPKVLDFGVAKAVREHSVGEGTLEGTVVGTPSYMSPEQALGRSDIDHRADLWSLGVIAYRALTGAKPFPSSNLLEVVVQICSETPDRPSALVPTLPPEIDAFFERALERDVDRRFQSAREMARALAEIAARVGSNTPRAPDFSRWNSAEFSANDDDDALELAPDASEPPEGARSVSSSHFRPAAGPRCEEPAQGVVAEASAERVPTAPGGDLVPAAEAPKATARKRVIAAGIALVGIVAAALVAYHALRGGAAVRSAAARAPELAGAPAESAPAAPAESALPAPAAAVEPSAPPPALEAPAAAPPRPAPKRVVPAPPRAHPGSDCDQPYYWEHDGTKHIKPKCL